MHLLSKTCVLVIRGNRVMGVVCSGGMSTLVSADKALMFPVPQAWSLEEAATVPVVYMTVLYGLIEVNGGSSADDQSCNDSLFFFFNREPV